MKAQAPPQRATVLKGFGATSGFQVPPTEAQVRVALV